MREVRVCWSILWWGWGGVGGFRSSGPGSGGLGQVVQGLEWLGQVVQGVRLSGP